MKKILGTLTLASTFLFGANNLMTIVEQNSLTKMSQYNIKSSTNPKDSMNIGQGVEDAYFHNFSPYAFTEVNGYNNDFNVIVMIGEKTIQYGSIYSKGFGEKYNVNTLVNLIKKGDLAAALNSLDTFRQDNLIFIRNNISKITNNDLEKLKNYIQKEVSEDRRNAYLKKIEVISAIVNYGDAIFNYTKANLNLDPVSNVFFDIKQALSNPKILEGTKPYKYNYEDGYYNNYNYNYNLSTQVVETKKEYEIVDEKLIKRCLYPNIYRAYDSEGYYYGEEVYYDIKDILSINLKKPMSISELYILTHNVCPTAQKKGKKRWRSRYEIVYPKIPSFEEQKNWATSVLKQSRNQGIHTNKIKSYFSNLQNNISNNLRTLNDIGIVDGRIMHISYNLTEAISNDKVVQGIIKNATVGTIFRDRFKVISSEGIDYQIKNIPNIEIPTYSELTKNDTGNTYGTLYYNYTTKFQSLVPSIDDFHLHSNLTPLKSKQSSFLAYKNDEKISASEIIWATKNDGTPISQYLYTNENEILNSEDEATGKSLLNNASAFLRSDVDLWGGANIYPINVKTIKNTMIPLNDQNNALKYFGPIYSGNVYLDKHIKVIQKEISLNCSKDKCTEEEKKMENPTRTVEEKLTSYYCGASFTNPDKKTYDFEILQDVQNRFIEKPFGDIQYHYNKEIEEDFIQRYSSNQKVPNHYQYVGQVESKEECLNALNTISYNEVKKTLLESVEDEETGEQLSALSNINFNFLTKEVVSSLDETTQANYMSDEEVLFIKINEILNSSKVLYNEYKINEATFTTNNVNYEDLNNEDTFLNYFKDLQKKGIEVTPEGATIIQIVVEPEINVAGQ